MSENTNTSTRSAVETVVVQGTSKDDVLYGSTGKTVIYGMAGNDTIHGQSGMDTMYGGQGNDSFYIKGAGDTVIEKAGEGTDTVYSSVSYTTPRHVENITLTGNARINGTGNNEDNVITGNDNYNRLNGGRGNDSIYGQAGEDTIDGSEGNDKLYGGADRDNIFGGAGDDVLDGGEGKDVMRGQAGDDIYYVDNVNDTVIEEAGQGTDDTIYSSVSYTAPRNVENITLVGDARINGTGNNENNVITGNGNYNRLNGGRGNDIIYGQAGEDTIDGGEGNDFLYGGADRDNIFGGAGNDVLDGGEGKDVMRGQAGDDIYYVDNVNDTVIEAAGEGNDTIYSSVSYTASRNVENITLTGKDRINGTGNNDDNVIIGNDNYNRLNGGRGNDTIYGQAGEDTIDGGLGDDKLYGGADRDNIFGGAGNDVLDGGEGKDVMRGQAGDDVYYVDNANDTVIEEAGQGNDTIYSSVSYTASRNVENITLVGDARINGTGNNDDNVITGNDNYNRLNGGRGDDTIYGNAGEDTIDGGIGDDKLYGGADRDNIFGGIGNDYIDGGTGNDLMRGQAGDDTYFFTKGYGHDVIRDTEGNNIVKLGGVAFKDVDLKEENGNWVLTLKETGDTLTIEGQSQAGESVAYFYFSDVSYAAQGLWNDVNATDLLETNTSLDSALDSIVPAPTAVGSVGVTAEKAVYSNTNATVYNDDNTNTAAVI
ncbi:calcium-binding protein [Neisseria dumasiana]|uniref:Haemolysin-type calcium binding-related domain-containing protein n=1 Tax=Neisseria dumasiana TaxID=1931275 RepID=A0A1X3DH48_9NEIS|nr:calcium-binding protein [Neisseria dumasiana]OSI19807.1 hypothetical protein BV912_08270 [Neisseria dumasiana]